MTFRHFLETQYRTACAMQQAIHLDLKMVEMLRNGPPDANLVQTWMQGYGLFQGIAAVDRVAIVRSFLIFSAQHKRLDHEPTAHEIEGIYTALLQALFDTVPRSWVSATSKLLWCVYPETFVIYDAFVHRTLSVMQCLDDTLFDFPRIGKTPSIRLARDIPVASQHYMNYRAMVCKLLTTHAQLLQRLRSQHDETYSYDLRIIDKLLWMIGNPGQAF